MLIDRHSVIIALVALFAVSNAQAEENEVTLMDLYSIVDKLVGPFLNSVSNIQVAPDDIKNFEFLIPEKQNELQKDKNNYEKKSTFTENRTDKDLDDVVNNLQDSVILKKFEPLDKTRRRYNEEDELTEYSEKTIILQIPSSVENDKKNKNIQPIKDDRLARYKKMKHKITESLYKEQISDKTKRLISEAFDKVITQMNHTSLRSSSRDLSPKNRRLTTHEKARVKSMLKKFKKQFKNIIDSYRKSPDGNVGAFGSEDTSKFLSMLRELFFEMHHSLQNYTERHNINCKVVKNSIPKHKNPKLEKEILRNGNESRPCQIHSICPYELKMFLTEISKYIFDTVDQIFSNYKNMYLVDVTKETSGEQKQFMRVLSDVKSRVDNLFNVTYIKENIKLTLNANGDVNAKLTTINNFMIATFNHVKMLIKNTLRKESHRLSEKLRNAVQNDIMTITDNELNNAKEKLEAKMCKSFETCYGKDKRDKLRN